MKLASLKKNVGRGVTAAILIGVVSVTASAHPIEETGWGVDFANAIRHGDSHLAHGEFARAWDAYELATELTGHAVSGHYKLALAGYMWGDAVRARRGDIWKKALVHVERARFLDPYHADAAFLSAVIRYRTGDYQGAVDVYAALERVREGDINLYLDLALAAHRLGDQELAYLALQTARVIDPGSKRLHHVALEVLR